ncbi:active regulator of SIRT1 [Thalassophryne amazonica]|uniref:active regulator of SIRT1 n=1 Tax=Thalassophryne amazonica TaxID=390379 RepID=UPI001470B6FF|nr:active regulator of SIRT1 [Thalassophryne amazonica]
MSASLLRRGLELLSGDVTDNVKRKKKQMPGSATVMELVSSNRQGVKKQVKRLQGRLGSGKSKATVKNRRIRSAVEEFRRKQKKSHLSANLKYLTGTSYKASDSETLKIQNQNTGRQSRSRVDKITKKSKEPQSLFTEEEFQQFQKEYFGRLIEKKK